MRIIKTLALAAIATTVAMASIGAGTASATALCEKSEEPKCGTPIPVGTALKASLTEGSVHLTSGYVTITCSSSTLEGKVTSNPGGTAEVKTEITTATLGGCKEGLGSTCTGKALYLNWPFSLNWTEADKGEAVFRENGWELTCPAFGETCIYRLEGTSEKGTSVITGGSPKASLKLSGVKFKKQAGSGPLCSQVDTMSAVYSVEAAGKNGVHLARE